MNDDTRRALMQALDGLNAAIALIDKAIPATNTSKLMLDEDIRRARGEIEHARAMVLGVLNADAREKTS